MGEKDGLLFLKKSTSLLWSQLCEKELQAAEGFGSTTVVSHILPAASEHGGGAWAPDKIIP